MAYEPFNKETATAVDRVAYALCQIIDADAPLRWTRYRAVGICIALNDELKTDLAQLAEERSHG